MLEWLFGKKKEEEPSKPKPSAQQAADDKWKYDFIVQFLLSPLWKTSILDFVDYNCVVFDSQQENKFQYTTIHNRFKELIANLFDEMMQEVGLDDQKLVELLEKGFDSKHKKIFNQLLLADDFVKFRDFMVSRNKILETAAIKAMQEHQQVKSIDKKVNKGAATEEKILRDSLISEKERLKKIQQQQQEQLRRVLELSKKQAEEDAMIKKLEQKVSQNVVLEKPKPAVIIEHPKEVPKQIFKQQTQTVIRPPPEQHQTHGKAKKNHIPFEPLPPLRQQRKIEEPPKWEHPKQEPPKEPSQEPPKEESKPEFVVEEKPAVIGQAETESQQERKKRLLEQRERIRRKKEEERRKQLAEEEGKTVPVQTIVLQDDGIHETQIGAVEDKKVSNAEVERRRELMKKIKNRIIDDL